jgi:uncharacterized Rossmann fold enzyme
MMLQPIDRIKVDMAMPLPRVIENIRVNSARGLPKIEDLAEWRECVPIALVGGGPSLQDTIGELRQFTNVMTCGSAHDYAVEHGVIPRWAVVSDPDPIMANYLRRPQPDTTYLVASTCDAAVFDAVAGHDVVLWHPADSERSPEVWGDEPKLLVNGGCTVGTRAMMIAISFGYSELHLFGFDNCVSDRHHAYDFTDPAETIGDLHPIRLDGSDRTFMMATYMVGQLFDFKDLMTCQGHRIRVTVHGDGALADLMAVARRKAAAMQEAA